MRKLEGRVALVTGGARGIGAGIVQILAENGADVAIFDWNLGDEADAVIESARKNNVWVEAQKVDVSSSSEVNQAVNQLVASRERIDILINNAGICPFQNLLSITDEIWAQTLNVNLTGMFYMVRAVAPFMMQQQKGAIVNVSTVSTHICRPHQIHYIASKGGVDALTRALAVALAPYSIRVNAIAPLGAATAINANIEEQQQAWKRSGVPPFQTVVPLKREGTPRDYANGVLSLIADESSYITGIVLPIDGGALAV